MKRSAKNPAKCDRCVKAVKKRGGAVDPYAVCTAAGTRNRGRRRNIIPVVPLPTAISQSSEAYQVGKFLRTGKFNPGLRAKFDKLQAEQRKLYGELQGRDTASSWARPKVKRIQAIQRQMEKLSSAAAQSNPAAESAEVFEQFHGYPPEEAIVVREQVHFHRNLAAAGQLEYLIVDTADGKYRVTVKFDPNVLLAFNESGNQLFVRGGDQSVDLSDFGIDPRRAHELETLGKATRIGYFTTKTHLGEDGGTAVYDHSFRMTNENGRHVTVRIAKYPDVIYRVRDKHLEFSGGSYKILPEGIDK